MKIAAAEALWDTQQPASFSLFQIGGFSQRRPRRRASADQVPDLLSYLATGSLDGKVLGLNQLQTAGTSGSTGGATTSRNVCGRVLGACA